MLIRNQRRSEPMTVDSVSAFTLSYTKFIQIESGFSAACNITNADEIKIKAIAFFDCSNTDGCGISANIDAQCSRLNVHSLCTCRCLSTSFPGFVFRMEPYATVYLEQCTSFLHNRSNHDVEKISGGRQTIRSLNISQSAGLYGLSLFPRDFDNGSNSKFYQITNTSVTFGIWVWHFRTDSYNSLFSQCNFVFNYELCKKLFYAIQSVAPDLHLNQICVVQFQVQQITDCPKCTITECWSDQKFAEFQQVGTLIPMSHGVCLISAPYQTGLKFENIVIGVFCLV